MSGLNLKEFHEGIIVWWTTDHWDNPCVVTEINCKEGTFKVFDLNDIRETSNIRLGKPNCCSESPLTEMRIPTEDEFIEYMDSRLEKSLIKDNYDLLIKVLKIHNNPEQLIKMLHNCN